MFTQQEFELDRHRQIIADLLDEMDDIEAAETAAGRNFRQNEQFKALYERVDKHVYAANTLCRELGLPPLGQKGDNSTCDERN